MRLLVLALAALLRTCPGAEAFSCPVDCTCSLDVNDYFIFCHIDGNQITLRYSPDIYYSVECDSYKPNFNYSKIPGLGVQSTSLKTFIFRQCPLPDTSLGHIISNLGFTQATSVKFQSYANQSTSIRREHLEGLGPLKTTRLTLSNGFTELPKDLLADSGNITWLSLFANRVKIPQGFFEHLPKLETLELSNNHLTGIPEGMLSHLPSLKKLLLWHNYIHTITEPVFKNLTELTDLDLSMNELTVLPPNVFENLENLSSISLRSNNFTSLPSQLFSSNKKLVNFFLSNNNVNLTNLPNHFLSNKDDLRNVELYRVGLKNIPDDIFENSTNIVNISLSENNIEVIPSRLFEDQKHLEKLILNRNKIKSLPDYVFANLRNLKYLDLSYNLLESISSHLMEALGNLRDLNLSHNKLTSISREAFPIVNKLTHLDMSFNQLHFKQNTISISSPLQQLKQLEILNLSHNNFTEFYYDWNNLMLNLKSLDLSYNQFVAIQYSDLVFLSGNSLVINLTHNRITSVDFSDIMTKIALLQENYKKKIPQVLIGHNPFLCNCGITYFIQYLQYVRDHRDLEDHQAVTVNIKDATCASSPPGTDLAGRPLSALQPDELLCLLDDDSLSVKYCPDRCQCFVRTSDRGSIFDCSDGAVDAVPDIPTIPKLNYTELKLQNNHLSRIRRNGSVSESVTKMFLDGNNLTELSLGDIPKNIEVLSLRNNNLVHLNASVAEMVLNGSRLQELWISGNPLACDCENLVFLDLLQRNYNKVKDYVNLNCPDGRQIGSLQVGSLCGVNSGLVSAYVIAALGMIAGFLAGAYYKYNHEIKVYLFARGICLRLIAEEELDKDKQYDAFVSYSHKDEEFVLNRLIKPLESGAFPFKLNVHCRDWIAGEVIQEQIARSVKISRRTIIVLSPNFVDSEWGMMEFRLAHEHAMKEHRARVIVVIYGDVDVKKLNNELRAYLTTNTYVKWGDPWFFEKLRYALPHPDRRLVRDAVRASLTKKKGFDDRLELIHPASPTTPPGSNTPPAHQPANGSVNLAPTPISKFPVFNGYTNGSITMNGLKVNGNAKHSEV